MSVSCKETLISMVDNSPFPGFRFCPTDEELISYYLKKKIEGLEKSVEVIPEVDLCKHEPWDLPGKSIVPSYHEWFFFSARGRKYPNGSQTKRATENGYWKATGKQRPVKSDSNLIGTKRTLVFHIGRAPEGERTNWIMHEYSIKGKCQDSFVVCRLRKKTVIGVKDKSPNCKSASQRGISPTNIGLSAASQVGIQMRQPQTGLHVEGKDMEFCSGKQSSSSHSTFIEHTDSTSDSAQNLPNETCSPQPDSEINQKDPDAGDDCFADILKEDIINLDYSSLLETPLQWPGVAEKPGTERKSKQPTNSINSLELPFQGTAQRRIKFTKREAGFYYAETPEVGNEDCVDKVILQDGKQWLKGMESIFTVWTTNYRLMVIVFVIMALLVLILLVLRGISGLETFTPNFML